MGDSGAQALHKWVHHVRDRLLLPIRGDCNLITGGPPCQSVSGNNRNALCAPSSEPLACLVRNRVCAWNVTASLFLLFIYLHNYWRSNQIHQLPKASLVVGHFHVTVTGEHQFQYDCFLGCTAKAPEVIWPVSYEKSTCSNTCFHMQREVLASISCLPC